VTDDERRDVNRLRAVPVLVVLTAASEAVDAPSGGDARADAVPDCDLADAQRQRIGADAAEVPVERPLVGEVEVQSDRLARMAKLPHERVLSGQQLAERV